MSNVGYHVFDGDTIIVMTCSDCNTRCNIVILLIKEILVRSN
jgi:hypothetical protein